MFYYINRNCQIMLISKMEHLEIGNKLFNIPELNEIIMNYTINIHDFSLINKCSNENFKKVSQILKKHDKKLKIIKETNKAIYNLFLIFLKKNIKNKLYIALFVSLIILTIYS